METIKNYCEREALCSNYGLKLWNERENEKKLIQSKIFGKTSNGYC